MGLDEEYGVVSRSAETRDLRRKHGEILRFSTIKEYYTKSEGLGFLIRKSRIDFRIEFRGVSILFEFNPLIWLVSHDHHQTVRYGEVAGVSIAESTFFNSSGHK